MRKLLVVISLALVLVAAVTGCGGAHRYDSRLTAADSLMQPAPDSALAIVEAINLDSLPDEDNRAYRDLLLTQARYRCYITATSDSDINRALNYYRAHSGEREKLTRAYLYKGAVMDELGHPDSAMLYYKHAEATANEKDYNNLGQINTRIASLYRMYYGDERTCFEKYQTAYRYHSLSGDKKLQLNSLYNMLAMTGIIRQENDEFYYNTALSLANELEDSLMAYKLYEIRCRQLSRTDSTHSEAKRLAQKCLSDFNQYLNNDLLLDLAYLYCMEDKPDSADYFINSVDENADPNITERISIRKHEILSLMALRDGNFAKGGIYAIQSSQASDSILNSTDKYGIERIENNFNRFQQIKIESIVKRLKWTIIAILLTIALLAALFTTLHIRKTRDIKTIIKELQSADINNHEDLINQLDSKSFVIERLVTNLVSFMKSCAEIGTRCSTAETSQKIKDAIINVADDEFWEELASYIDKHHGGIFSTINKKAQLTKSEIRLIELACCGFSDLEMAIILGYSTSYVSNKRSQIANKLHIDVPLKTYLNILMKDRIGLDPHRKQ